MTSPRHALAAIAAFALLGAAAVGGARALQFFYAVPAPAEYLAHLRPDAKVVQPGELAFDGQTFRCGRFPAVLDAKLNDYAEAYFGFVLLNPERFGKLPLALKRYAYGHECGHQYVGYDEGEADCYSIRRGRQEGWLDAKALDAICDFISRSNGDEAHVLGGRRCDMMRRCFARSRTGREPL